MAKKKVQAQPAAKEPMTKRELSRWQKQHRQERLATGFVAGVIILVIGILAFGYWNEVLSRPGQVVARAGASNITLGELSNETKYRMRTIEKQIALVDQQVRAAKAQAGTDSYASFLAQYGEQQLQQLESERLQIATGQPVLDDMIQYALIKQEAQKRGISVSTADVDAAIEKQFQPQAPAPSEEPIGDTTGITETTGITGTTAVTATASMPVATATPVPPTPTVGPSPTVTPSPTPIPADAWKTEYQSTLATFGISDSEFRRFTMEPNVWRTKLSEAIGAEAPTTAEQVHLRHIVLNTVEDAKDVLALLKASPSLSFAEEAKARTADTATKDQGGDMGWTPRDALDPAVAAAAFALQPGQISDVITTTSGGFEIIKLEEKASDRPLEEPYLGQAKSDAFDNWLQGRMASADVQRFYSTDKQQWLQKQIPANTALS